MCDLNFRQGRHPPDLIFAENEFGYRHPIFATKISGM